MNSAEISTNSATISLIVAMSENNVIGRNNNLPWKLPGDLQYFREKTWGKPIIMGRKTFESLKRPLPGRSNIVVTRDSEYVGVEGINIVNNIDKAVSVAQAIAGLDGVDEVMIIGGAQIYAACLPIVQRLYITQVHAQIEGDTWFPEFDRSEWELVKQEHIEESTVALGHSFLIFERKL